MTEEVLREQIKSIRIATSDNCTAIKEIRDNHLPHLQTKTNEIEKTVAKIETDGKWMKWIAMASVGALITSVVNLVFK